MGFGLQTIYSVDGLDFDGTYENLRKNANAVKSVQQLDGEYSKGTFSFTLPINANKKTRVQISHRGTVNIWHKYVGDDDKAVAKLKPFIVPIEGKKYSTWILKKQLLNGSKHVEVSVNAQKSQAALENKVQKAIEDLRFLWMRNPQIIEIAYRIGENPTVVDSVVYKFSPTLGWRMPDSKEIEKTQVKLGEIYEAAALLQYFPETVVVCRPTYALFEETSERIIKRARYAQKYEASQLPKVFSVKQDEKTLTIKYSWPPNARRWSSEETYYKDEKRLSGIAGHYTREFLKVIEDTIKKVPKTN